MAKLTKAYIDRVKAPGEGYEIHWDDALKGYGRRPPAFSSGAI